MTLDEYNDFCASLPHAAHVVQWGGAHVWKVGGLEKGPKGGKVFAIGMWPESDGPLAVTFKCSDIVYEVLRDADGCRPAPYLASRGMTWIQRLTDASVSDAELTDHLRASYALAALGLTKKRRTELGLLDL
ncbi:MmcQ/YjbR family DNA-binding protein [Oceanicaulis sp. MMSF_3324]|uniref:MmcQ/YjbR family DNA-binding protein n=1 Tax=Oceanicaulis sp. MMSF_3324 TaxID=3046702 RepID=UPI00273E71DA|nr:MmcQ/YjbR family DNA-binding protein [Oceanicaulis sp. MMSF_3324]